MTSKKPSSPSASVPAPESSPPSISPSSSTSPPHTNFYTSLHQENSGPNPWNEKCFQWCKERKRGSEHGMGPHCSIICLRRKPTVLNMEKVDQSAKQEASDSVVSWNPLSGYYIIYSTGIGRYQRHTEEMSKSLPNQGDDILTPSPSISDIETKNKIVSEHVVDLGQKVDSVKKEVTRIVVQAFTPGYNLAVRYSNSWTDGTQAAFFNRFLQSVWRADAINIVKDNAKRVIETLKGKGNGGTGSEGRGFGSTSK